MRACTVISKTWVAHARALAESLRAHEPGASLDVLIVDSLEGFINPAREPFEVLTPADLQAEEFDRMSVRYDTQGLCCALKPRLLAHTLGHDEPTVYLDADMRVYAPLDDLVDALQAHPFLLTPHLLAPLPEDGREPSELAILLAGSFNLGFVAARPDDRVHALLDWWASRLRTGSRLEPARAMLFDQRWADLMPGFTDSVGLLRGAGWNFGFWRAATAKITREGDALQVDGEPLRCVHFTGVDASEPQRLSRYDSRTSLEREPVLRELVGDFIARLNACGHEEASRWPYEFAATASGAPLTAELRELWDRGADTGQLDETPFTPEGERAFLRWLAEPDVETEGEPLSRYLTALHESQTGLRERFPDPRQANRDAYLAWAREQAERHPDEILALLERASAAAGRTGLRSLQPGERVGAERGETVVCIPVYGAKEAFAECLASVLAHTPPGVRVLIADDASPDPALGDFVREIGETADRNELLYLRQPTNLGFPGNVNAAFAAAAPADVVVLNSDVVVAAGWLEGMRRAAYSDPLVATASALTNHGTILSVPERNRPRPGLAQGTDLGRVAGAVLRQSLRLHPRLPTAIGHCVYVRRHALDLVGDFDLAFSPGYGEEVDFSQRCLLQGLVHVAADDVFVLHHAGLTLGQDGDENPLREAHERVIDARYPYYQRAQTAASEAVLGPLPRALGTARRAITGVSATVDGRCLGPIVTGTQVHTLEVIRALSRSGHVPLRVITPPDLGAYAGEQIAGLENVELIPHTAVHPQMQKTDIAHRPYQVSNANDLLILRCVGERTVITHQDLIAYGNPGYFPGYPQWDRYRRLTRQALATADGVVFFSRHAARDALKEDLVDSPRVHVVYLGVDHLDLDARAEPHPPRGLDSLNGRPLLLCLGTDFRHKNRMFALRLLQALRKEHDWDGVLVLAGPRVSHGSSASEEAAFLATRPDLASAVITLPAVSDAEKTWLLQRSAAVLYPTTYEGFGLMPFEAAAHDRPCLFAAHTALAEVLPPELGTLVPWDVEISAARVKELLDDPDRCAAHIRAIRQTANHYTWQSAGESLIDVYRAAAASPAREATGVGEDLARTELELDELKRKYNELWSSVPPEARVLADPSGPLSGRAQRTLAAVATRPLLRRLIFGPLQLAYRLSLAGRHDEAEEPVKRKEAFALHFGASNIEHMREQLAEGDPPQTIPEP